MPYADLCLPVSATSDPAHIASLLSALSKLGYSSAALAQRVSGRVSSAVMPIDLQLRPSDLGGIKVLSRVTCLLEQQDETFSLTASASFFQQFDLVAAQPVTEKLFHQCCTALELDILTFDMSQRIPFFFKPQAVGAAISRGIFFEITYSDCLRDTSARRNLISNALSLVRITKGRNMILSSQAKEVLDLRGPYDASAIALLFGLSQEQSRAAVSSHPSSALMHAVMRRDTYRGVVMVKPLPKSVPLLEPNGDDDDDDDEGEDEDDGDEAATGEASMDQSADFISF